MSNNWIQTFSGRAVEPGNFTREMVDPIDIAHALSNVCRFTGHVDRFYSVAEHSLNVMSVVQAMLLRTDLVTIDTISGRSIRTDRGQTVAHALMHDASEAYLADIAAPVKRLPEFDGYRLLESRVQGVIEEAFDIRAVNVTLKDGRTMSSTDVVKEADLIVLKFEAARLMLPPPKAWGLPETRQWESFDCLRVLRPLKPIEAQHYFVQAMSQLCLSVTP